MARCYNFYGGPSTLPLEVLEQAQAELLDYQGLGMSIMEISHRGKEYQAVHDEARANLRELLTLSDDYEVLFMQGGARMQFSMVPLNLATGGRTADYVNTGYWAKSAIAEAKRLAKVHVAADTSKEMPARVPNGDELDVSPDAAYLHITTNETISGAQWKTFPRADVPLVGDMSSDILSRPVDASPFGLIYAGAQKNLGPAGVTLVIMRRDLAGAVGDGVSSMLEYKQHIEKDSLMNTPPSFCVYMLMLTTRWLKEQGLAKIYQQNAEKAAKLYSAIDAGAFYSGVADPSCRSDMNVTFTLPSPELDAQFIAEAEAQGMKGLKGHRSLGGIRASIYNAFPVEGVDALVAFMKDFESRNG